MFGGPEALWQPEWPNDRPIVDALAPGGDFNDVTAALGSVGLGSVPTWLRPYQVLSNGEKFRADLARLICEAPATAVVDEFTSVVDRQIAKFGALAFSKSWRRLLDRKVVLLTPHYDVIEWLEPDWVFDTAKKTFARGRLRRPQFNLQIWKVDGRYWPLFEPHHYLKLPRMVGASYYVGTVDGELVCHLGVASNVKGKSVEARACRLVVMPEWQGAGVGFRFLNEICAMQERGDEFARLPGRKTTTIFHTSHPQLCAVFRRDRRWRQLSAVLHGVHKGKSKASINASSRCQPQTGAAISAVGYGGHMRAVQGFRFYGQKGLDAVPTIKLPKSKRSAPR
ncbi:ABC transporter ATP-binding protein [Methylobacterium haplocladii]|uniref:ABC transporter ATP-binding protein n=1 Tax=Methylobacterium haplocladii TaxID=1176176 RepID=UPI0024E0BA49|nr:ABC transporter ATP-binding protein [Methylobacterium haplocladii]